MRLTVEAIKKRYNKARSNQDNYRDLFESAYELALPQRNMFSEREQGESKMEYVYTSVGMEAVNSFVNRMQSALTQPFMRWAELVAGPLVPEDQEDELNELLSTITDTIFNYINGSNFNTSVSEMYYDLAVGTGALLVLEGKTSEEPYNFVCVPQSELALEEGVHGTIGAIFRKYKLKPRLIKQTWPDAGSLPSELEDNPEKEVELTEATYYDDKEQKWYYDVLYSDDRLVERTMLESPWIIVRWSKLPNEVYGRGPLLQALPDLKMYNKMREYAIRSYAMNAVGMYTVMGGDEINVENIVLEPGALIPVQRNGGPDGASISALPSTGDFQMQEVEADRMETAINRMMMNDKLPPMAGPVKSATEIVERIKDAQVDIGAAYGRLMYEFVIPLFKRLISIGEAKGIIVMPEGIELDNLTASVSVLSPIARTQRVADVENTVRGIQTVYQLDPTGQIAALLLKMEETGEFILRNTGTPADLINTDDEREAIKAEAAQVAQAQAAAGAEKVGSGIGE